MEFVILGHFMREDRCRVLDGLLVVMIQSSLYSRCTTYILLNACEAIRLHSKPHSILHWRHHSMLLLRPHSMLLW